MSSHTERLYTITELAGELGVTPRAIRFYESKGLLSPQRAGSNRVYTYRERARLLIVLRGKRLGFTLRGIREYLDLYDVDPGRHVEQLEHLLRGARQRMAELERQRGDLELTLAELREVEQQTLAALGAVREQERAPDREAGEDRHASPPEPDEGPGFPAADLAMADLAAAGSTKTQRRR